MPAPNLFLVYVTDAQAAAAYYRDLLDIDPSFTSPHYVAFEAAPGVLFAVWSGHGREDLGDGAAPGTSTRRSETGLMVPGSSAEIDALFALWSAKGVTVVQEPHDAVFGRTFVIADPDGNLIRVSPID